VKTYGSFCVIKTYNHIPFNTLFSALISVDIQRKNFDMRTVIHTTVMKSKQFVSFISSLMKHKNGNIHCLIDRICKCALRFDSVHRRYVSPHATHAEYKSFSYNLCMRALMELLVNFSFICEGLPDTCM
jgi:hypothetical protein